MIYFLAGVLTVLITLVVYLLLTMRPDITAGTYIEKQETDIGKIKQRGENNTMETKPPESLVEWLKLRKLKNK